MSVALLFGVAVGPVEWLGFAGAGILVGAAFAVINQGLAAAFGAVGRTLGLLVAIVALVAGLTTTVPPAIASIAAALPTAAAQSLLLATLTNDGAGVAAGIAVLALFTVLGVVLVYAGVATRRRLRVAV